MINAAATMNVINHQINGAEGDVKAALPKIAKTVKWLTLAVIT